MTKTEERKIWIIGGANIDILGTAKGDLIEGDSNPGKVELRFGGVGRNIAQNIAVLGKQPYLITCFGDDYYGGLLKEDCLSLGMNIDFSKEIKGCGSSIYLALMGSNGDMKIAMNDMAIFDRLTPEYLEEPIKEVMRKEDLLILDANLSEETMDYVFSEAPCPVAVDPVSVAKINKLKKHLGNMTAFKPNRIEAEELSGIKITDVNSGKAALEWFLEKGVKEIIITMADKGILLGTGDEKIFFTHRPITMDNATGGGDSFLGAYALKREEGVAPREAAKVAITAAVMNIESDREGRRNLSRNIIEENIKYMNIEETEL